MNRVPLRLRASIAVGFALLGAMIAASSAAALDIVRFKDGDVERRVAGTILVEAQDGGMMLKGRDTRIWIVQPPDLIEKQSTSEPYSVLPKGELTKELLSEFGTGFDIHETEHYLIVYNTSKPYARWCGQLLERLYSAFYKFWKERGFNLHEPEAPLVAVVFENKGSYVRYAASEMVKAEGIIGYYSLKSNRVAMYDLSEMESRMPDDAKTLQRINNFFLARPDSERTIATIIHEATHQLVLNSGLQERYAPIPLWNSEGLAVYFETPDLRNSKGWGRIGHLNHMRLLQFREYCEKRRGPDSLLTLIAGDERLRDDRHASDAYAEAWAFTYFAMRKRKEEYLNYMRALQKIEALAEDSRDLRLKAFREAFGDELDKLDKAFLAYMRTQRIPGQ
jgi:hypothetical protein